jgi:hypothetical protein
MSEEPGDEKRVYILTDGIWVPVLVEGPLMDRNSMDALRDDWQRAPGTDSYSRSELFARYLIQNHGFSRLKITPYEP